MNSLYVQYGCGLSAPQEWVNFDVSPTLRIQKTPVLGALLKNSLNTQFPANVQYGDIISGLPIPDQSCDGIYCSHTLEHLSLQDFRIALRNTLKVMKPGAYFRCVVPDLENAARAYVQAVDAGDEGASLHFIGPQTLLGIEKRPRGLKAMISTLFGNSHHLWMWDRLSLAKEFRDAGFTEVRQCNYNDAKDPMFKFVEDEGRFYYALAMEGRA
jgi:predicted SAM-dependent methyltransferase